MNRNSGFQKQGLRLQSLTSIFLLNCVLVVPAAFAAEVGAPSKLAQLEKSIVGKSTSNLSIEQRIRNLEIKVFSKPRQGSLSSRINALEKFAGITSSDFMPPLPPQFDNGKEPVKTAPDRPLINATNTPQSEKTKDPNLEHKLEEAVKLHHEGKDFEAEQSLKKILEANPRNADAYFSLGAMAESRGDIQTALEFYTSAMQSNPNDPEARQAVAELSRKITALRCAPFVNPIASASAAGDSRVLQGRAWQVDANSGARNNNFVGQAPITAPQIPNLPIQPSMGMSAIAQRNTNNSSIARTFARAALGAALSGTGLHCPVCHLMRGF